MPLVINSLGGGIHTNIHTDTHTHTDIHIETILRNRCVLACGQHMLGYKNVANIITGPVRYQLWEAYINWMSKLVATGMPLTSVRYCMVAN